MKLIIGGWWLVVVSLLMGADSFALPEKTPSDLVTQCTEAGFALAGEEQDQSRKPSHEDQVAFVKAYPKCPPYEWWEIMQEILIQAVQVEIATVRLETLHRNFPDGTHIPNVQLDLCARCAEARIAQDLLTEMEQEGCGFPESPDITEFCSPCPD